MWLLLALLAVPLIEIGLFIEIGGVVGVWPTILSVLLTAAVGIALVRRQGFAALRDLQRRVAEERDPGEALAHGALIVLAGVLLLVPGFFTDAIGLLLLVPPIRAAAITRLGARVTVVGGRARHPRPPEAAGGQVIEVDYEEVSQSADDSRPAPRRPDRPSGWTRGPEGEPD